VPFVDAELRHRLRTAAFPEYLALPSGALLDRRPCGDLMLPSKSPEVVDAAVDTKRNLPQIPEKSARRRVLIVDDEPLIRWSIAETLGDRGCAAVEAADGHDALQTLSESSESFDVVLLDFCLPDSRDLSLLSRIRALLPGVPLILMTAYVTAEIVQAALDLGAYRVINKPFEMDELAQLVTQAR
jgi:CheY-like chemotaxis protein